MPNTKTVKNIKIINEFVFSNLFIAPSVFLVFRDVYFCVWFCKN